MAAAAAGESSWLVWRHHGGSRSCVTAGRDRSPVGLDRKHDKEDEEKDNGGDELRSADARYEKWVQIGGGLTVFGRSVLSYAF